LGWLVVDAHARFGIFTAQHDTPTLIRIVELDIGADELVRIKGAAHPVRQLLMALVARSVENLGAEKWAKEFSCWGHHRWPLLNNNWN